MTLDVEGIVDDGMKAEKALRWARRLETPHLLFSSPDDLMWVLYTMFYNFIRIHKTLKISSAMANQKSTKTESSIRKVPIHDNLIRLGLLDWVASRVKESKNGRIWPKCKYSRWWNEEFTPTIGVKTPTKVFHSLRHLMEDRLTDATTDQKAVDRIMGHFRNGMGARYGDKYLSAKESAVIDDVVFDVDLSPLQ